MTGYFLPVSAATMRGFKTMRDEIDGRFQQPSRETLFGSPLPRRDRFFLLAVYP